MDWNLVISSASLGFAPITVWLARQQLKTERIKETAYSINVNITQAEHQSLSITHTGITPLHQVEVWATIHGTQRQLHEVPKFEPGDKRITEPIAGHIDEVFVAWFVPNPQGKGLRAEAVRVQYPAHTSKKVDYWQYYWWSHIRLVIRSHLGKKWSSLSETQTRFPLGRWKPHRHMISRPGDRPGWPTS
ncbi:hypothetical protein EJK80_06250 [Corynebacterium phoceense]|uniref:Uncharacterized protein n=1 Tax=Corynebacterium phoceense TaxID=1686286 RepID=A0A540R7A2_9CORY|nr:hypothetical protein [Corynebacterium phoceense]TQE43606.1 hypothetical protein EJK80_06250 [Corynebacterium phoceense]